MNSSNPWGEPPKIPSRTFIFIVFKSDWEPSKYAFVDTVRNNSRTIQANSFAHQLVKCAQTDEFYIQGKATLNQRVRHRQFMRWLGLEPSECRVFPIVGRDIEVQINKTRNHCKEEYIRIGDLVHWKRGKEKEPSCLDVDEQDDESTFCRCSRHVRGTEEYIKTQVDPWFVSPDDNSTVSSDGYYNNNASDDGISLEQRLKSITPGSSCVTSPNSMIFPIKSNISYERDSWYLKVDAKRKEIENRCEDQNRIACEQGCQPVYLSPDIMDRVIEEEVEIYIQSLEENQRICTPRSEPAVYSSTPLSIDLAAISCSAPTTPQKVNIEITIIEHNDVDTFINEKCIICSDRRVRSSQFYDKYKEWCVECDITPLSYRGKNGLPVEMAKRNYILKKFGGGYMHYFGIDLL
jgi:hypothetical protein